MGRKYGRHCYPDCLYHARNLNSLHPNGKKRKFKAGNLAAIFFILGERFFISFSGHGHPWGPGQHSPAGGRPPAVPRGAARRSPGPRPALRAAPPPGAAAGRRPAAPACPPPPLPGHSARGPREGQAGGGRPVLAMGQR